MALKNGLFEIPSQNLHHLLTLSLPKNFGQVPECYQGNKAGSVKRGDRRGAILV